MMWLMLLTLAQAMPASSPVVRDDGSIELTLAAPHASAVRVWGDWQRDGAEEPMRRLDSGVWTLKTSPLSPGPHLYAFIVDGLRMPDPENRRVKNGYPGLSSIIEVPNQALSGLKTGVVHVHSYTAPETGLTRTFHVYTPARFTAGSRLPVLYLLHGSTDSDRDWLALGQAAQLLEQAIKAGTAAPMLLVMPDGHPHPSLDVSTRSENLRLLQRELQEIIAPAIERDYHPAKGVEKRAAGGASMGGAQVLHLAARTPALFGTVVGLSAPGDIPGGDTLLEAWRRRSSSAKTVRVHLLCGTGDPYLADARRALADLQSLGAKVEWTETPGTHDWSAWRDHLTRILPRLFR